MQRLNLTGSTPYLIAEIGVNHFDIAEQREISALEAAKKMVAEAVRAGADAVKFQSYSADRLASRYSPAYWDTDEEETETQHELFSQYDGFGAEEFKEIATWTENNHEADFLSTPFDFNAVDYLEDLVPAYKVASADITNHPLLEYIAGKGKPILLSTGASTIGEIDEALQVIKKEATELKICLLHCVLQYPTDLQNANLGMIEHLRKVYSNATIGYSDHVPPDESMITLINATFRGAEVIEKHFTLDKELEGNDHYHAMNPKDIRTLRENAKLINITTGQTRKEPVSAESDSRKHARRSLVASENIQKGEEIKKDSVSIKRPGTGIEPSMMETIIGREASIEIKEDQIIHWEMV